MKYIGSINNGTNPVNAFKPIKGHGSAPLCFISEGWTSRSTNSKIMPTEVMVSCVTLHLIKSIPF